MGTLTQEEMRAQHGRPVIADTAVALRTIGKRQEVHPNDAVAFLYRDQDAADAFAAKNLEKNGYPSLGSYATPLGVIGVLDVRTSQVALGRTLTDPSEPD